MSSISIIGIGMVGGALDRYFKTQNIQAGLFDPPKGLKDVSVLTDAEIVFVAVPTPFHIDGSGFDDSFIRSAIDSIPVDGKTIVIKSTVLPGTTDHLQDLYPQHRILFNPEFLTEATADFDMQNPKRQIVGFTSKSQGVAEHAMKLLPRAPFERVVPAKVAELVKYFSNALYALKVAYANQFFDLCQQMGVPYDEVKECAKTDPMVGTSHWEIFHKGYRGYGGKCLAKDTRTLIQVADAVGVDLSILKTAESYNNSLVASQGLSIEWREEPLKK